MTDTVANIAKGAVAEYVRRVNNNDPANSALVVVALKAAGLETHAVLKDYATLAAVLAASNDEATNTGYARKVLTDTDLADPTIDTTADKVLAIIGDQTWTTVQATGGAWGMLVVCYDADTTSGTDANLVPLTFHDFAVTPDGTDIVADFSATEGFFQAT